MVHARIFQPPAGLYVNDDGIAAAVCARAQIMAAAGVDPRVLRGKIDDVQAVAVGHQLLKVPLIGAPAAGTAAIGGDPLFEKCARRVARAEIERAAEQFTVTVPMAGDVAVEAIEKARTLEDARIGIEPYQGTIRMFALHVAKELGLVLRGTRPRPRIGPNTSNMMRKAMRIEALHQFGSFGFIAVADRVITHVERSGANHPDGVSLFPP